MRSLLAKTPNAFLPVLFLVASLLSGEATLLRAHDTDIYLTGLGILLTVVYLCGLIFRPRRYTLRMGIDSFAVLALYLLGVAGLIAAAPGSQRQARLNVRERIS